MQPVNYCIIISDSKNQKAIISNLPYSPISTFLGVSACLPAYPPACLSARPHVCLANGITGKSPDSHFPSYAWCHPHTIWPTGEERERQIDGARQRQIDRARQRLVMRGLTHNPQSYSYIRGADGFMVIKYWRMCVAGRLNKEKQYLQNIQCIILVQFLSTGFLGFLFYYCRLSGISAEG